jgi:cyclohexadieny/prephenate dehydrogenase
MTEGRTAEPLFERVALIGVGLIGASLARVMRRDRLAGRIDGCVRSAASRAYCLVHDIADAMHDTPGEAAADADLVVLCTPVGAYAEIAEALAPDLKPGAILTDVGSVKQAVVRDVGPLVPEGVHFVPGHPVAGTERSGPQAGFAELFEGRWCVLTSGWPSCGAAAAPWSRSWSHATTTRCWPSPRTCPI